MHDWIVAHEVAVRVAAFAGTLVLLLVAEACWPRRTVPRQRALRWSANLPMVLVDAVLVRVLVPLGAVGAALWAEQAGFGLLHHLDPGPVAGAVIAFVLLDLAIYWQHRLFHHVPWLWRLHRMHHSDVEIDATTALRFHPLEIVLSVAIKIGVILALGAPALGVIAFEIALNGVAMFNHANLGLPARADRFLRAWVVTPDMHRVHHSVHRRERDSNFGFNLPWWDHLFRSYTAEPADGHAAMGIGLHDFRTAVEQRFVALLLQPLRATPAPARVP